VKCIRHPEDATDALQNSFHGSTLTCDDITQLLNHYATLLPYFQVIDSSDRHVKVLTLPSTHRIFDQFRPTFSTAAAQAGSSSDPNGPLDPLDSGSSLRLIDDLWQEKKRELRERNRENNRVWRAKQRESARRKRAAEHEETEEAKE
jgi:hypothetical protein